VEFRSEDGGFTLLFPGPPLFEKSTLKSPLAKSPVVNHYYCISGGIIYDLLYGDMPLMGPTPTLDGLEGFVQDQARSVSGTVSSERPINIGGYDGVEYAALFTNPANGAFPNYEGEVEGRIIAIQRRVYMLAVFHSRLENGGPFLSSFAPLASRESRVARCWRWLRIIVSGIIRVFFLILGVCFVLAFFLWDSEVDRLKDAFAALWVRVDDRKGRALSRNLFFLQGVSRLTAASFDRLLGPQTISLRSVTVFAAYTISSCALILWWYDYQPPWWGGLLLSIVLATASALVPSRGARSLLLILVWGALLFPSPFLRGNLQLGGYFFLAAAISTKSGDRRDVHHFFPYLRAVTSNHLSPVQFSCQANYLTPSP
jgi:hypothetical protein